MSQDERDDGGTTDNVGEMQKPDAPESQAAESLEPAQIAATANANCDAVAQEGPATADAAAAPPAGEPATDTAADGASAPARKAGKAERKPARSRDPHPLLHKLAEWHPRLFGARFLPLKVGIYEDLIAAHPELPKDDLKAALAWHARSTPYLEAVAVAGQRHDLNGEPVTDLAPEHRHHAIMEVFRRRQHRTPKDLRPWLIDRLVQAIEAASLDRESYTARVHATDELAASALDDAFALIGEKIARRTAVRRAFEASGKSIEEFAQMYGMDEAAVRLAVA